MPFIDSTRSLGTWTNYTPTWAQDSGVQPVLGNGLFPEARYIFIGSTLVDVQIRLYGGSTTTWGNNVHPYSFSLPFQAANMTQHLAMCCTYIDVDGGPNGSYHFGGRIEANGTVIRPLFRDSIGLRQGFPVVQAQDDSLCLYFSYCTAPRLF